MKSPLLPKIIFEDNLLMVVDKPAGWTVNRAKTTGQQKTIQDWLEENFHFPILRLLLYRAGIVHRLDKETSGLLLVAKTREAFNNLQSQFKERKVEKKYLALVHGKVEPRTGAIEAKIGRSPFNRQKFGVFLDGREAKTEYQVLAISQSAKQPLSYLELSPKTGRTHQIRVHLKFLGYPIVADEKYAGRKTNRDDRQWCSRHFLHANFLSFLHPKTGETIEMVSPLPKDLKRALSLHFDLSALNLKRV